MKYNFKIGERVQLYRRETNPLGGNPDGIPPVGSVGVVKTSGFSEVNNCEYATVKWDDRILPWAVRCCNLKRIKQEPIKEEKKEEGPKEDELILKADEHSLVQYRYNGILRSNDICYASAFRADKLTSFEVYHPRLEERHHDYINFIINESPVADAFINKDAKDYYSRKVIPYNCNIPSRGVFAGAVALRCVWEYSDYFRIWTLLANAGVNKSVAVYVANLFRNGHYSSHDGHCLIHDVKKIESLRNFINKKFVVSTNMMEHITQEYPMYGEGVIYSLLEKNGWFTKDQYGYKKYKDMTDDMFIQLGKQIEEML